MKRILVLCVVICTLLSTAVFAEEYVWDNVALGGGGFVTGLLFHPAEQDLLYARTDVGGMYRWDKNVNKWKQLSNGFSRAEANMYGVDGIAIDPKDPNVLFMVAGKYWWKEGGLFKSVDRGETWKKILEVPVSANMSDRDVGECIALDPYDSNIIYFGTRRSGMYRSDDGGESWTVSKDIKLMPEDPNGSKDVNAIRTVVFDPRKGAGDYAAAVYISTASQGVFVSKDNGASWQAMEGSPSAAARMAVDQNGVLYAAGKDGLYKFENDNWSDISPAKGAEYRAVAVAHDDPNFIVASANTGNIMLMPVFVSEDGGKTWRDAMDNFTFTKQAEYYEDDNISANTCCVTIDPFNKKHVLISDWHGIWETEDITKKPQVHWNQKIRGIEEMCPATAVCPPEGKNFLLLATADNDGFPISNIYELQSRKFTDKDLTYGAPRLMVCRDIAICEQKPEIVVRVGQTHFQEAAGGYSLDGGETWQEFPSSPFENVSGSGDTMLGARVAISAGINEDTGWPTILIGQNKCNLKISRDMGKTWTENPQFNTISDSIWDRKYNTIASDKVIHNRFYIYYENCIYVTDDGGTTWREGAETEGTISGLFNMKTPPGRANELWYTPGEGNGGLYHSTDGGMTMEKIRGISDVILFCFGMAQEGSEYPTIFAYATVNQREGIYRSVDYGKSWEQIDIESCKVGNEPIFMEGDRQHFGVVYIGTDGSGTYYGAPAGTNFGGESEPGEVTTTSSTQICADGKFVDKQPLIIKDGKPFVPIRSFFENLGAKVSWDNATQTAYVTRDEYNVQFISGAAMTGIVHNEMAIKDGAITFNGESVSGEVIESNDYLYAALDDIQKIWNLQVQYQEKDKIYYVYNKGLIVQNED